jgi:hypothetical protein
MLGRFRFTLAHEAGHWCLHRQYYLQNVNQRSLFPEGTRLSVVRFREGSSARELQHGCASDHQSMHNPLGGGWTMVQRGLRASRVSSPQRQWLGGDQGPKPHRWGVPG